MRRLTKWKFGWSTALLLILLAACNVMSDTSQQPAQSDEETQPGTQPRALVLGEVSSPVIDELGADVKMEQYDGSQDASDYGLIIFDGDALTPEEVGEHKIIRDAVRLGTWVLGLDVTGAHKKDGLGKYLNFASGSDSPGYLVRMAYDSDGRPHVVVLEHGLAGETFGDVAEGPEPQAVTGKGDPLEATTTFVATVIENVKGEGLSAQQDQPSTLPDGSPPDGLLSAIFTHSQPVPWTIGDAGKKNGSQSISYKIDSTFYVYLDNSSKNVGGSYQWVIAEIEGQANPNGGSGTFLNMAHDEKAWWQDRLKFSVQPTGDDASSFDLGETTPETANGVTQVTSGTDISIGFDGLGGAGSVGYSSSETRDLSDWKVTNDSSGVAANWDYRSSNPDADQDYACADKFHCNGFDSVSGYPSTPPDLSINTMQAHAQAIWTTTNPSNQVLTDWVAFELDSEQHIADTYCPNDFGLVCLAKGGSAQQRTYHGVSNTYSINMAVAAPNSIHKVSFSSDPNPVPAGEEITATVTLSSPAQINTIVYPSSDLENAAVSLSQVTIPQGQTSADFQILTNANGMNKGDSLTANINVFYNGDNKYPLTVTNTPFLDLAFSDTTASIAQNPMRTGSVTLSKPAPAGGVKIDLNYLDVAGNSRPDAANFPPSVIIPQGETSAPITITFTLGGPPGNAFGFFLRADGGDWGEDEVEFVVSAE